MSKIKNFKIYGGLTLLLAGTVLMTGCPNNNTNDNYNSTNDNNYSLIEVIDRNEYKHVATGVDEYGTTLYETYSLQTAVYKNKNGDVWYVDSWVTTSSYQNEQTEKQLTK